MTIDQWIKINIDIRGHASFNLSSMTWKRGHECKPKILLTSFGKGCIRANVNTVASFTFGKFMISSEAMINKNLYHSLFFKSSKHSSGVQRKRGEEHFSSVVQEHFQSLTIDQNLQTSYSPHYDGFAKCLIAALLPLGRYVVPHKYVQK